MEYFMKRENVEFYKDIVGDFVNHNIIDKIKTFLPKNSSLLELGIGKGLDLVELSKSYTVLGTDNSPLFIEDFKMLHPKIPSQLLDAVNFEIKQKFDCIYANKVLQHLTKIDFITSIHQQKEHLNDKGFLVFSLWEGKHEETWFAEGQLRQTYYESCDIQDIVKDLLTIKEIQPYSEIEENDSLLVILQKN